MIQKHLHSGLLCAWYKLHIQLSDLHKNGTIKKLSFTKYLRLVEKWNRYIRRLITVKDASLKAFNICCIAITISISAKAQNTQCEIFSISDDNNPIKKLSVSAKSTILEKRSIFSTSIRPLLKSESIFSRLNV